MDFAYGETVTRQRATTVVDPYSGEPVADWTTPTEFDIEGCAFDPGGSTEIVESGRTPVTTQPTVYAPADADVTAQDRLVVRGRTWQVDGDPALWRNPWTGWTPGLVIKLEAVEG